MRFPLIWAVPCPSLLGVVMLPFSEYCGGQEEGGTRGVSLIYSGVDGKSSLLSAVCQGPIKLFIIALNSLQLDVHFDL